MKLLSIIIPFHNSTHKCTRLLSSLHNCEDQEVELIFVDDGSTDNTLEILRIFKNGARCAVTIIAQENKGPGGARNAGIHASKGQYLWFVDSDDDIRLDLALDVLRKHLNEDVDFIDFNLESGGASISSMSVAPGVYGGGGVITRFYWQPSSDGSGPRYFTNAFSSKQESGIRSFASTRTTHSYLSFPCA